MASQNNNTAAPATKLEAADKAAFEAADKAARRAREAGALPGSPLAWEAETLWSRAVKAREALRAAEG